jgi:hypothetical protein
MVAHAKYAHDLAISAVAYDTLLLHDLSARLAARLQQPPVLLSDATPAERVEATLLNEDVSRVVLILGQRLWGKDDLTNAEAAILRERARRSRSSVIVVSLDDDARPAWMTPLQRCDLATDGLDGVVEFVLDAVAAAGGNVRQSESLGAAEAAPSLRRWPDAPVPFLGQPRAAGALRRELDALCTELQPRVDSAEDLDGEHICELHKLPHRVIARLDDVSVSFSWVRGQTGAISDGRLMVIEWKGVAAGRGVAALKTAKPVRERLYHAEANGATDWCWRADGPNGRASSTANLVGEWMDGVSMSVELTATSGAL